MVTELDHTQCSYANTMATFLGLFASKRRLPVSITHVTACSIMGWGLSDGRDVYENAVFSWYLHGL